MGLVDRHAVIGPRVVCNTLVACHCHIFFVASYLPADIIATAKRTAAVAGECCFPDHAENARFKVWESEEASDIYYLKSI